MSSRGRKRLSAPILAVLAMILFSSPAQAMSLSDYVEAYTPGSGMYISSEIKKAGARYDIDPLLLASIFYTESRYSSAAVSAAGAVGIAQLMPETAREMGRDPYDPSQNIDGGARYFRQMLDLGEGRADPVGWALSAYNAGPGAAEGGIPSYTLGYIGDVRSQYRRLREIIDEPDRPRTRAVPSRPATRREAIIARLRAALEQKKKALAAAETEKEKKTRPEKKRSDIFFF